LNRRQETRTGCQAIDSGYFEDLKRFFELFLFLFQKLFYALYFSILKPKSPIFLNQFNFLVVFIKAHLLYYPVYFLYIFSGVFFVLVYSEEVRFLGEECINLLIKTFKQLKRIVISLNFLDKPSIRNNSFKRLQSADSQKPLNTIPIHVVILRQRLPGYSTKAIHDRLKYQNELLIGKPIEMVEIEYNKDDWIM